MQPLVSIICLSYNHAPYIADCLASVFAQTYPHIELIVIDDASTDGSQEAIAKALSGRNIPALFLDKNMGNCRAFNKGLALAKGKYVIDLAADDVLMPHRVARQVQCLEEAGERHAVAFSDAELIDAAGRPLGTYYRRGKDGALQQDVPQGNVYAHLLRKAFICTPTMMMRKSVLDALGGYDESLEYEDYDFWVRSGRNWLYIFQDEILTKKRILRNSLGMRFYSKGHNPLLASTLDVCKKAKALNVAKEEDLALAVSVRYHARQSLFAQAFGLALEYLGLLEELDGLRVADRLLRVLAEREVPLHWAYRRYLYGNSRISRWAKIFCG